MEQGSHGVFTSVLAEVWNRGQFKGSYRRCRKSSGKWVDMAKIRSWNVFARPNFDEVRRK